MSRAVIIDRAGYIRPGPDFLTFLNRDHRCRCDFFAEEPWNQYLCDWCEDADERERLEDLQDGECPCLEELEEIWSC